LKYKRSKRIFISPTGRVPNPGPDASIFDFVSFWDSIEQNIYLNRSPEFDLVFRNYSLIVTDYFQTVESGADAERKRILKISSKELENHILLEK
jgi:hypothetical protein